jgi:WD40 repeat protein
MNRLLGSVVLLTLTPVLLADGPATKELKGHTSVVYSLSFSPDGKTLATGSYDNTIKLWDFAAGKEIKELKGHTAPVYSVAFSPDGMTLASSSTDKSVRLWNVADGKEAKKIDGHTDIVDSVAWSPDGKLLASGSADKSVRLWNPIDGKEVKNLGAHPAGVYIVVFSQDGKQLASCASDGTIKVWDVEGQKEIKTLPAYKAKTEKDPEVKGHKGQCTSIAFSPDGKTLYSVGLEDQMLLAWDPVKGELIKERGPMKDGLCSIVVDKDGKRVLTSGYGGSLTVWDPAQDKPIFEKNLKEIDKKNYGAYCVLFSPDGKFAVTAHDDKKVVITPLMP